MLAEQGKGNVIPFTPTAIPGRFFPEGHKATIVPITPDDRALANVKKMAKKYRAEQNPSIAAMYGEDTANKLAMARVLCPEFFRKTR